MAATPYDVADAFRHGRTARRGAFVSNGDTLYSYGLKLAHWQGGRIVVDVADNYRPTITTARHIRAMRARLPIPELGFN